MKNLKSLVYGLLALTALGFTACQDDIDAPSVESMIPHAEKKANTTILELKNLYWDDDATNYIDTIGYVYNLQQPDGTVVKYPRNEDGTRMTHDKDFIIHGRVISSDEAGNVYKSLIIQDETAALAISINNYNLYLTYRIGQDVVIDLKGMYMGKYSGLLQLGYPQYNESYGWQTTFMSYEVFQSHTELNGIPEPSKVDILTFNTFAEIPTGELTKMQSQLVRLNNVHFEEGGKALFSEYQSSGVDRTILDSQGNSMIVRTSGYANFWNQTLPEGDGDIVCLLNYYNSGYQLTLVNIDGLLNFGNPTVAPGTENKPYTIDEVIEKEHAGLSAQGWVTGYIVGAVKPEVTEVTSNDDIQWQANVDLPYTLVIGATPETKNITSCLVVELPEGSSLEKYGNLVDNPANYKKQIKIKGEFGKYMETFGISYTTGQKADFEIEGVDVPDDGSGSLSSGDGSAANPFNCADAIAKAKETGETATSESYYIKGYVISGSIDTSYGNATFKIADTKTGEGNFIAYRFLSFNGAKFTDAELIKPGDLIVVYAPIVNYKGNTPETAQGGKLISINGGTGAGGGNTGGDTPAAAGDGSQAKPFNCAAAVAKAQETGTTATADKYYIEGYVVSGSIDTSYGNATFKLADAQGGTATFTAFRFYDLGGEKFTDANKIKVGDKIVIYANIVNYMGNTPETTAGGQLISINDGGNTGGGNTGGGDTPVAGGNGTLDKPFSCEQAAAKCAEIGTTASSEKYYVEGYVISGSIDTSYGNATFKLADAQGGTATFTAFRFYDYGGEKFTDASKIKVGDKIVVCGNLVNYMGNTPETTQGGQLISINGQSNGGGNTGGGNTGGGNTGGGDTPAAGGNGTLDNPFNCAAAAAKAAEVGTTASAVKYYVEGYVISGSIDTSYGNATFKLADAQGGTATFTAFRFYDYGGEKFTDASKIKVGDKIVIYGNIVNYMGNTPETTQGGQLISINGATN